MTLLEKYPKLNRGFDARVDIASPSRWFYDYYRFKEGPSKDFNALLLPWKRAWFEYPIPKAIKSMEGFTYIGVVAEMYEAIDEPIVLFEGDNATDEIPGGGYVLELSMFVESFHRILNRLARMVFFVDQHGSLHSSKNIISLDFEGEPSHHETVTKAVNYLILPVHFSICLLNCRNVELVDKQYSRQVLRQAERKGKELIKYKELVIEPFKKQVRAETAGSNESEIHRALHICRGHFATYSEERPLFGKYTGTFWKPMHVKGSKKYGEVRKSYKVDVE